MTTYEGGEEIRDGSDLADLVKSNQWVLLGEFRLLLLLVVEDAIVLFGVAMLSAEDEIALAVEA